jgi:hypothetical protein
MTISAGAMIVSDVSAWVGIGLTALALTGGCVAFVHTRIKQSDDQTDSKIALVHERIRLAEDKAEAKVAEAKRELEGDLSAERAERMAADDAERSERRREHDKLEGAIDSFRAVGTAVVGMVEGVKHLGERFVEYQRTNDRALDEIKHGVRAMDSKIQAAAATATRRAKAGGE